MNGIIDGEQIPANGLPIGQDLNQLDFAVRMLKRYLAEKNVRTVGVRRLHYFIVSLPENERIMPGRSGSRPYQNTKTQYQGLSDLLVDARRKLRVESGQIIDEKNIALIPMPDRESAETTWEISTFSAPPLPDLYSDVMHEWSTWLRNFKYTPYVSHPVFNNQKYRVVVCIEKATSKSALKEICYQYGADLLIFSGQFSVTRVYDICHRAEDEDKPILLLYISDLDVGGWSMAPAFLSRIREIYAHDDHLMIRIALTRDQVVKYRLPPAFDPSDKGYSDTQIANFIRESGGRDCVELDAVDEHILLELLETELRKHTGEKEDNLEYNYAVEYAEGERNTIDLEDVGIEEFQQEYDAVKTEHNLIVTEITALAEKYRNKISDLNSRRRHIEDRVEEAIRETYGFEEHEWDVQR
jgi:hypothetical protein